MQKKSLALGFVVGFILAVLILGLLPNTNLLKGELRPIGTSVCKLSNCDVGKKIDDFLNRYAQDWEFTNTRDARIEQTLNNFFNRYAQDFEWMRERH